GDGLADGQRVGAAAVGPGRELVAVHLAQLGAGVASVLGGDAARVGGEDHAVALLVDLEERAAVAVELGLADGVGVTCAAGGQGEVPISQVKKLTGPGGGTE